MRGEDIEAGNVSNSHIYPSPAVSRLPLRKKRETENEQGGVCQTVELDYYTLTV